MVQVDEPALPAVLTGRVPTASGFHRHRSVDPAGASPALEEIFAAVAESGATPVVHCCDADVPFSLLRGAGAVGVSVDLDCMGPASYDALATVLDEDGLLLLGVVPATRPGHDLSETAVTERVQRFLDMVGLDQESVGDRLVLTPACGLAGADAAWSRRALALCHRAASNLTA